MRDLAKSSIDEANKKTNVAFYDKVYNLLQSKIVIVGQQGLNEFPHLVCMPGQLASYAPSESVTRNILDV